MKKHLRTSLLYTLTTAVVLGLVYPAVVTGLAQILFHDKANGQLMRRGDVVVGSRIIGQAFTGPGWFHDRPSAAGSGYDGAASSGSNLGPSSKALVDRVSVSVKSEGNGTPVPIDLVTASGSGLDPDITPAAAYYQAGRVAGERHLPENAVRQLVAQHVTPRQFGLLGEPVVNVLQLNLDLDSLATPAAAGSHGH